MVVCQTVRQQHGRVLFLACLVYGVGSFIGGGHVPPRGGKGLLNNGCNPL